MFLKNVLLLICFFSATVHAQQHELSSRPKYDHVISLGDMCQVAQELVIHHRRYEAYPFDWVLIPFESLYQFIQNDGANFLDSDKLVFINNKPAYIGGRMHYIEDTVYHIQLLHDFESVPNFLKDYDRIKAKYNRRINRYFNAVNSDKNILFIRMGINYQQAVLLDDLIHTKYPQLNYTLLALDNTEEIKQDWGLERVKNFYLGQMDPWHWIGDTDAWLEILNQFDIKEIVNAEPLDDHENR